MLPGELFFLVSCNCTLLNIHSYYHVWSKLCAYLPFFMSFLEVQWFLCFLFLDFFSLINKAEDHCEKARLVIRHIGATGLVFFFFFLFFCLFCQYIATE